MKNSGNFSASHQRGKIAEIEIILGWVLKYANELNGLMSNFISLSRRYAQDLEDILKQCQELNARALSRSFNNGDTFYALISLKNIGRLNEHPTEIVEKIDSIFHQIDVLKQNIQEAYDLIVKQKKQKETICKNGLDSILESITCFLDFLWRLEIEENNKEVSTLWEENNEVYSNLLRCYHNLIEKLNQTKNL
jgi:hypothetical protein